MKVSKQKVFKHGRVGCHEKCKMGSLVANCTTLLLCRGLDEVAAESYRPPERVDPEAEREALLRRIADDGGRRAAVALLALHGQSPRLAEPVLEYIANRYELIDELLLCIGDSAVHEAKRREAG